MFVYKVKASVVQNELPLQTAGGRLGEKSLERITTSLKEISWKERKKKGNEGKGNRKKMRWMRNQ